MSTYEENPWWFRGEPFRSENIGKFVGFVYVIECLLDGKKYIGRKYFHQLRKVRGKTRRQRSESNWKDYWSSSEVVQQLIDKYGEHNFRRTIISLHTTKGDCNWYEVYEQVKNNVLESTEYLNDNINGKWYRKASHIIESRSIDESIA